MFISLIITALDILHNNQTPNLCILFSYLFEHFSDQLTHMHNCLLYSGSFIVSSFFPLSALSFSSHSLLHHPRSPVSQIVTSLDNIFPTLLPPNQRSSIPLFSSVFRILLFLIFLFPWPQSEDIIVFHPLLVFTDLLPSRSHVIIKYFTMHQIFHMYARPKKRSIHHFHHQ